MTPSKANSKRNNSSNKRVVFEEEESTQVMEGGTPAPEEQQQLWYSAQEFDEIRRALLVEDGEQERVDPSSTTSNQDNSPQDTAGAQQVTTIPPLCLSHSRRAQAQRNFVRSLLDQQNEHSAQGIRDPRGLYQFSRTLSKSSRMRAVEDAKYMARDCQIAKEQQQHPSLTATNKDLVRCIDMVLDLLDAPLPTY